MSAKHDTADEVRDSLLDDIARGVQRLDLTDDSRGLKLWSVDVALLDEVGATLVVAPLSAALVWVAQRLHQTEDLTDISGAVRAHVLVHEHYFSEPHCTRCQAPAHNSDTECPGATPNNTLGTCQRVEGVLVRTIWGVHYRREEWSKPLRRP